MFLMLTNVPQDSVGHGVDESSRDEPVVIVKADPGEAEALRETHANISPGYHLDQKHWITVAAGDSLDKSLIEELVTESYRLAVATLPKSDQPIDPETYGNWKLEPPLFAAPGRGECTLKPMRQHPYWPR